MRQVLRSSTDPSVVAAIVCFSYTRCSSHILFSSVVITGKNQRSSWAGHLQYPACYLSVPAKQLIV